ncbi:hypothetical protein [Streptomyces antimycoticus]|nr:hypothetical protein [Streptomyces antimycoticus]
MPIYSNRGRRATMAAAAEQLTATTARSNHNGEYPSVSSTN